MITKYTIKSFIFLNEFNCPIKDFRKCLLYPSFLLPTLRRKAGISPTNPASPLNLCFMCCPLFPLHPPLPTHPKS